MFKMFVCVFGLIGLEFKLKVFFGEYLGNLRIPVDDASFAKVINSVRNVFLKFCHEFYLMGLISRKRPNSEVFIKNFFKLSGYYKQ